MTVELNSELVAAYAAVFLNRADVYPVQLASGPYQGRYKAVHEPLTSALVVAHLTGELTLGAYALNSESMAKWVCFDADDASKWEQMLALAAKLQAHGIPVYRELSRRGGHLWLLLMQAAGLHVRRFGLQLLADHHIDKVEVYPKQYQLSTGPGSFVRLPLGVHRKDGKRYYFVDENGQPLAPSIREQLALLAAPQYVPQAFFFSVLAHAPQPKLALPSPQFTPRPDVAGATLSERIKNAISVLDFVSQYVELDSANKGFCPFHDDEHQSFQVHTERNFWHCYAGCPGQTVIDFWMNWRTKNGQDGSFVATVKDLADLLHIPAPKKNRKQK